MTRRAWLLGLVGLAACGWLTGTPDGATSAVAPAPAEEAPVRLVSLSPALTETVAALGALDTLVGRSEWCALPPEVTALPAMGSSLTPELERLAALQPTAILIDGSAANRREDLAALAPVVELPWLTVAEVADSTRRLGALTAHEAEAEALAVRLEALDVAPAEDAPEVLLALAGDGLEGGEAWFLKRNSLHGTALHAAGARHAIDRDVEGPPTLSLEALVRLDPDHIVIVAPHTLDEATEQGILDGWRRLETLTAIEGDRITVVGGPTLLSTGPSILDTVDVLREAVHEVTSR